MIYVIIILVFFGIGTYIAYYCEHKNDHLIINVDFENNVFTSKTESIRRLYDSRGNVIKHNKIMIYNFVTDKQLNNGQILYAKTYYVVLTDIDISDLHPGDIVFFNNYKNKMDVVVVDNVNTSINDIQYTVKNNNFKKLGETDNGTRYSFPAKNLIGKLIYHR